ncbi:MAG: hypothetical protein UX45_C0034G0009 [Candidatus Uhrbacteria bacterium GW2011_GWF2_46_218]|uniref:Uncharacterized protein n=1 Tax=Candidatus Uhrbacteria bacterium GW2011_GWF2_46_218 TaxID=1619001 RepID=A0A0G1PDJ8_9BACT|nr:MAG: hypothetical protein UX45_C0034G0009 [Candidatus Uhrbacteria bacterium GW2011_GWF2_46_218]
MPGIGNDYTGFFFVVDVQVRAGDDKHFPILVFDENQFCMNVRHPNFANNIRREKEQSNTVPLYAQVEQTGKRCDHA